MGFFDRLLCIVFVIAVLAGVGAIGYGIYDWYYHRNCECLVGHWTLAGKTMIYKCDVGEHHHEE